MAAIANLVLPNNAAVNKTFIPLAKFGGINSPAKWILREGLAPMAYPRVEINQTRSSQGSTKVEFKVVVPEVVSVSGVPTLVSTCLFDSRTGGFIIPEKATSTQIADLYAYTKALLASAAVQAWVTMGDPQY